MPHFIGKPKTHAMIFKSFLLMIINSVLLFLIPKPKRVYYVIQSIKIDNIYTKKPDFYYSNHGIHILNEMAKPELLEERIFNSITWAPRIWGPWDNLFDCRDMYAEYDWGFFYGYWSGSKQIKEDELSETYIYQLLNLGMLFPFDENEPNLPKDVIYSLCLSIYGKNCTHAMIFKSFLLMIINSVLLFLIPKPKRVYYVILMKFHFCVTLFYYSNHGIHILFTESHEILGNYTY
ncbi:hypothetical protein ACJX0J_033811, partial [Zea mays]